MLLKSGDGRWEGEFDDIILIQLQRQAISKFRMIPYV